MKRKLFCEISPLTYRISTKKEILMRKIQDLPLRGKFARVKQEEQGGEPEPGSPLH